MRLSQASLDQLSADIDRPVYDRMKQACGIVHFGIGAFHRAHQAVFTDDAMNAGDQNWRITGVSLRSASVAKQLNPQDGLYTVVTHDGDRTKARLIGSEGKVLVAPENPDAVIEAVASPTTDVISFTITEKGYCRSDAGSLDREKAGQESVYAFLAAGLLRRMERGRNGVTLLSCDNLANNGAQLKRLLGEFLSGNERGLWYWITRNCTFPSTMVDRIVPATTDNDRAELAHKLGMRDEACVVTEPFSQWVIEDKFAGPRPRWEVGGVEFVDDVTPYEMAKLRMLNGAHSALAYLGLLKGYQFVHQAIGDAEIRPLIESLMRDEAAPTLRSAPGQDLNQYADSLLSRFANSALPHRLIQIAMDGSQKIPQRWLETLAWHQERGQLCPAILQALAAWIIHIRGDSHVVDDPMAAQFAHLWHTAGRVGIIEKLFGTDGLFSSHWVADAQAFGLIARHLEGAEMKQEA